MVDEKHESQLEAQIMETYELCSQTEKMFRKKLHLRKQIYDKIHPYYLIDLYVVGSSVTGLASDASDADMCLVFNDLSDEQIPASEALCFLEQIRNLLLKKKGEFTCVELIHAKVPLLKFKHAETKIRVDMNLANQVGIRNTHLLKCYADLDVRVAPLVIAVKKWAAYNDINNAHRKSISSYSLTLMVVNYLQVCKEPVLPCLQTMHPDMFHEGADIRRLCLNEKWPEFESKNKKSVSELFCGFMEYYAEKFNFSEWAVSVRTGNVLQKRACRTYRSPTNSPNDWTHLAVEEPYERTNAARSVHDAMVWMKILNVFRESNALLKQNKDYKTILYLNPHHGHNNGNAV
jgi:poly(A) RNA polymerase GLD2